MPPLAVRLQQVFGSGLDRPIDLQAPPGDSRLSIAERPGRIRVVQGGVLQTTPFLDISSRVYTQGEAGLLSFAFHPQFASAQRFVFVHFVESVTGNQGNIVVERYSVSTGDPNLLDVASAQLAIRIPHTANNNHYGGRVAFGPDGMFYLSVGDGGGGGDPSGNGQNAATLLGKLLRLDISTLPATFPDDNPIWPSTGQRNENWAIGLRNPFRYAFDAGQLYIADVGQNEREEIDVVQANSAGLNYGWNLMEGLRCFPNGGQCNMTGLTLPVYDYDHSQGCSIIGGYVYRGAAIPELQGQYLFSDYCRGFVRSLSFENGMATVRQAPMVNVGTNVTQSFGQDGAGELYILTGDGRVLRIVR
ncbi:MAG: PQQ-dependent sugar dehydrogenase [Betaproteobacteria bacterium]|nr:MAG: PQQ-dependent sugar dehydrogenase [Betaproteobacteria bacterium]